MISGLYACGRYCCDKIFQNQNAVLFYTDNFGLRFKISSVNVPTFFSDVTNL